MAWPPVAAALADDLVAAGPSPVGDGGLPIPVAGTASARLLAADVGAGIWPADGGLPIPVAGTVSALLLAADVGAGIWPADGSLPGPPPEGGVGCVVSAPPLIAAPPARRDPSSRICAAATSFATDAARAATVNIPSTDFRMGRTPHLESRTRKGTAPFSRYELRRQQMFGQNVACAVQYQTQEQ